MRGRKRQPIDSDLAAEIVAWQRKHQATAHATCSHFSGRCSRHMVRRILYGDELISAENRSYHSEKVVNSPKDSPLQTG